MSLIDDLVCLKQKTIRDFLVTVVEGKYGMANMLNFHSREVA